MLTCDSSLCWDVLPGPNLYGPVNSIFNVNFFFFFKGCVLTCDRFVCWDLMPGPNVYGSLNSHVQYEEHLKKKKKVLDLSVGLMFGPVVLFLSGPVSAVTFFSFFKCILIFVCVYFVWWIWCFKSLLFLRSISWGKDCNAMFLFFGSSLYFLFLSLLHFTETYTDGCLFWLSAYVLGVTLYSGWSLYILMVTTCSSGHFWHIFFIVVTRWHFVTAVFQWLPHFVVVVHFGSTGGCYGRHGVTWSQLLSVSLFLACVHECVDHETLFKGSLPQVWQLQDIDFVAGAARCSTWPQVVMVGVLTVVKALRSVHNRCFCGGQIAFKAFVMGVWMVVRSH